MPVDLNTVLTAEDCIQVAQALSSLGKHEKGIPFLDIALEKSPENIYALVNKGSCLVQTKRSQDAKLVLAEATRIDPDNAAAWMNMGAAHAYDMEWEQARLCYEVAIWKKNEVLLPEAHKMLALNFLKQQRWDECLEELYKALVVAPRNPAVLLSIAQVHMLRGEWDKGLPLYESRHALRPGIFVDDIPAWTGQTDLSGQSVLLLSEQGAGDIIQFARYASLLKDTFPRIRVHLRCPDDMVMIMQRYMEFDSVTPFSTRKLSPQDFDFQMPLMSVPLMMHRLGRAWMVPPCQVELRRQPSGVAFAWRGNPSHDNDRFRSLKFEEAVRLSRSIRERGRYLYSIQKDSTEQERNEIPMAATLGSWSDTAECLRSSAQLVTVDTAVAHLAGTLGVPTILMLPANPDWRWGVEGDKTPWYPSVTLVRQTKLGEWSDVFDKVLELV